MAPLAKRAKTLQHAHVPKKINDVAVLPVTLAPSRAYPHSATHFLYMRPDVPKTGEEVTSENQKSLFIANLPVTSSEAEFRALFKSLASTALVDTVAFSSADKSRVSLAVTGDVVVKGTKVGVPIGMLKGGKGRKRKRDSGGDEDEIVKKKLAEMELPLTWARGVWESGSSAVVRFVDRDAMVAGWKAVLRCVKEARNVEWPSSSDEDFGLARYQNHHTLTYPAPTLLHQRVNAFLSHYAALESARASLLTRQRNIPDEDGFVTVTRGGRAGAGRLEDAQAAQARLKERRDKKEAKDFYRFQSREERKKREGELKRRFEGERRLVEGMRKGRGAVRPE